MYFNPSCLCCARIALKIASNQSQDKGNNGSGKRLKTEWNEKNNDIFIMVCVEQVRAGNKPHVHFNRVGWSNVIKNFNEQTGLSYEHKQMKNKWDLLRKEWQLWKNLRERRLELGGIIGHRSLQQAKSSGKPRLRNILKLQSSEAGA